jgi:steroid 5-alpha reductase family enzyme
MSTQQRPVGFTLVTLVYVVAVIAFLAVFRITGGESLLWRTFVADVAATLVVFLGSVLMNNSSVYDPYWSVLPPLMFIFWIIRLGSLTLVSAGIVLLTVVWAFRLTLNWASGWRGLSQEDWRYREFRERFGRLYWPVSLVGIHLVPTVAVFLASIPVYFAIVSGVSSAGFAGVAALVTAAAISVEATADRQLHRFKAEGGTGPCTVGLWRVSRHPNYLGELGFWFGLLLFGFAAGAPWWSIAGMAVMVALFAGYSIPAMERKVEATRPSYRVIREQVPALVPIPGRSLSQEDERLV